jgi:fructose-1,6-bisphosphatase/sedoheptulose 1,7-bisphosphatase-like protein
VQLRQEQALGLQQRVAGTQAAIEALRERADSAAQQVAVIRAGQGHHDDAPSFLPR